MYSQPARPASLAGRQAGWLAGWGRLVQSLETVGGDSHLYIYYIRTLGIRNDKNYNNNDNNDNT